MKTLFKSLMKILALFFINNLIMIPEIHAQNWREFIRDIQETASVAKEKAGDAAREIQYDWHINKSLIKKNAKEFLLTINENHRKYKQKKKVVVYGIVEKCLNISVATNHGNVPLAYAARDYLSSKFHNLTETGLLDDPALSVTALICMDKKYFTDEMKLVKKVIVMFR